MEIIFKRRSIRKFLDKDVEQEKITKILNAGMNAPSSGNQQCWEFIVVSGKENLEKLSQFSKYAVTLKNANVAILTIGNKDRIRYFGNWQQDMGACTQNILLEACYLGLGSTWYGVCPDKESEEFVKEFFALKDNEMPYNIIGIGYPLDENANKFVDRFDESRIRYIK